MVLLLRLPSRCSLALDAWLAFQGFFCLTVTGLASACIDDLPYQSH